MFGCRKVVIRTVSGKWTGDTHTHSRLLILGYHGKEPLSMYRRVLVRGEATGPLQSPKGPGGLSLSLLLVVHLVHELTGVTVWA